MIEGKGYMGLKRSNIGVFASIVFACLTTCWISVQAQTIGGWQFDWSDEFDRTGTPVNEDWAWTNWHSTVRDAQFKKENAWCENGLLIIEGRRGKDGQYTSSAISGQHTKNWLYGKFEMRGRIDIQLGSWPAWWTCGATGGWPGGGEIDMMEYYKGKLLFNVMNGAKKWKNPRLNTKELGGERWSKEFHTWTMEWDSTRIDLFLDDTLINHYVVDKANGTHSDGGNPFRKPQYMILNQAVGAGGGDPGSSRFPLRLEVDWVRHYKWVEAPAYALTVNGGSGTGSYIPGTQVSITANMPKEGTLFKSWKGPAGNPVIKNPNLASTVIVMPSSDLTITAEFGDLAKGAPDPHSPRPEEGHSGGS